MLFNGKDLSAWRSANGGDAKWRVKDGFVEVPAEYVDQVLDRMRRVKIRKQPVTVKMATPKSAERPGGKRRGPKRRHAA